MNIVKINWKTLIENLFWKNINTWQELPFIVFLKLWSFKFEYIFEIEMFITVEQAKILTLVITLRAQKVKNPPTSRRPRFDPWAGQIPWRMEWQPTPLFLPEEFHGQRRLVGYSPWTHKESGTTKQVTHTQDKRGVMKRTAATEIGPQSRIPSLTLVARL